MSDFSSTAAPIVDTTDCAARQAAMDALEEAVRPANKTALFDALAAAGITAVIVTFDGYGDSGQIEEVDARKGDDAAELPTETVEIAVPRWGDSEPEHRTLSIADAIETLAYDFLRSVACGWENNDGAYGDFTFVVADRSIWLDYNERIMRSDSYEYEF